MSANEYTVRIEPHGKTLRVAADRSILEAALSAGLNLPHSCRSGHCASCRAKLVSGEIHYPNGRTAGLTAQEADAGHILLCQARPRSDLRVEARIVANVGEAEIKTLPCRIARMDLLSPDVMQLFLRLPAVESLQFRAGQYLDVLLEGGRRRSFSIANPPHDSEQLELHVRRVFGGQFTRSIFEKLRPGALLRIEGPIGQFIYREADTPALFIAGGTGFAPLKSMLRHALERGSKREIHLYWGALRGLDVYEESTVLDWTRQFPQLKFTAVLSEPGDADAPGPHRRLGGYVHEAVMSDHPNLAPFDIYAAGPPAMIEAIRAEFPKRGVSEDKLHFDSFDYAPDAATR